MARVTFERHVTPAGKPRHFAEEAVHEILQPYRAPQSHKNTRKPCRLRSAKWNCEILQGSDRSAATVRQDFLLPSDDTERLRGDGESGSSAELILKQFQRL